MTEKKEPEKKEPEKLAQQAFAISKRVQINSIWLASSNLARKVDDTDVPDSIELTTAVKVNYQFDEKDKNVNVAVSFLAAGAGQTDEKCEKKPEEDSVFRIEASFVIQYHVNGDEPCESPNIDAFARMNGIYNAWPYWREYLQSSLGRMGLPPIVLEVLTQKTIEAMVKKQVELAKKDDAEALASAEEKCEKEDS